MELNLYCVSFSRKSRNEEEEALSMASQWTVDGAFCCK